MIRVITDKSAITDLARRCVSTVVGLDRANAVGWGEPLRGVFLFEPESANTAVVHVLIDPECRGKEAIEAGRECIAMLRRIGLSIVGETPKDRRDAILYARLVGMTPVGESGRYWYSFGGA